MLIELNISKIILYVFLGTIALFQLFYILNVIIFAYFDKEGKAGIKNIDKKISIIIPLFNSEKTIDICLDSVLKNNLSLIDAVVIILDHCSDTSADKASSYLEKFKKAGIRFEINSLGYSKIGKVNAIKSGMKFVKTENIVLLDADIVLKNDAIEKLLNFHLKNSNIYSSCLIYPYYKQKEGSLISRIIYQDRLYRQNILKIIKEKYNVANFPGSFGIVNMENYKNFLSTGFLEDLAASFRIISARKKIAILPAVLAYEVERQNFKGLFFQRVRWSIGNIENIPLLVKTIFSEKNFFKKFLIISYPIMWYIQHYCIVIGIIVAIFIKFSFFLLTPLFLYFVQILISVFLGRKEYKSTFLEVVGHCIIFPFIVSASLFGAIIMIIMNKKFYFRKNILFNRN